jgi:hypothetical protein
MWEEGRGGWYGEWEGWYGGKRLGLGRGGLLERKGGDGGG